LRSEDKDARNRHVTCPYEEPFPAALRYDKQNRRAGVVQW
jgi:hypothetical protein